MEMNRVRTSSAPSPSTQPPPLPSFTNAIRPVPKQENQTQIQEQTATVETASFAANSLSDSSIRRKFAMKVYLIVSAQLLVTVTLVAIFLFVGGIKKYVHKHVWVYITALAIFWVTYVVLLFFEKPRRSYPGNFIALFLFTLVFSYMVAAIASFHDLPAVVLICGVSIAVTLLVTLSFAIMKIDFTICCGLLVTFIYGFLLFCFSGSLWYTFYVSKYGMSYGLQGVFCGLVALVILLILAIGMWLILNKDGLGEEEYVFSALQLYIGIILFFLILLGFQQEDDDPYSIRNNDD